MNSYTATDALNETEGELEYARNQVNELRQELAEAHRVNSQLRSLIQRYIDDVNGLANELTSDAATVEKKLNRL